jgi:hypothetical protein
VSRGVYWGNLPSVGFIHQHPVLPDFDSCTNAARYGLGELSLDTPVEHTRRTRNAVDLWPIGAVHFDSIPFDSIPKKSGTDVQTSVMEAAQAFCAGTIGEIRIKAAAIHNLS